MLLKIGWLYRFTKHWTFVFKTQNDAIANCGYDSWAPALGHRGQTEYRVAYTMPPETIFMVVASYTNNQELYQVLFNGKIGWINYKHHAQIDTSLNP